jgi:hypothetical protein
MINKSIDNHNPVFVWALMMREYNPIFVYVFQTFQYLKEIKYQIVYEIR